MSLALILITLLSLFTIVRPLTTFFHELGHGIAALFLTKGRVTLYIGSYGDPKKSIVFKINRLTIFFKYNPLLWEIGLCIPNSEEITIQKQILITILGPTTSLLIALLSGYVIFISDQHGSIKIFAVVLLASSLLDFFINVLPKEEPIKLHDGTLTFNDGQQLKQLLEYKKLPKHYLKALKHYNKQEFKKASLLFEQARKKGYEFEDFYRLAISCYLNFEEFKKAELVLEDFKKKFNLNSDDYSNSGLIKSMLGHYEEAIHDYNTSLKTDTENKYTLNNRGYTYNLLEQYNEALFDFERAIKIDSNFAHSINNRGLSKIKLGLEKEGLEDIKKALKLDGNNAYVYLYYGIYHFDRSEYKNALVYFEKAKSISQKTHLLQQYIEKTVKQLN